MHKFLITYDLRAPGQDYETLWEALRRWGAKRALESVWILKGNYTTVTIRDAIMQIIDKNDRLLVVQMDDNWASYNTMIDINKDV